MNTISASIVVYKNNIDILSDSIKSCLESCPHLCLHIIDNSPTDSSKIIQEKFNVDYTFVGQNLGFGKAHNLVISKVIDSSKYHIIINPDVYFDKDVIPRLYNFMEENPHIGMVVPKVLYPNGQLQYLCKLLPKPSNLIRRRFMRFAGYSLHKPDHRYEMRFTGYNKIMDVPFVSGCFMFVRTEALKKTGLFDENIFLYTEDIDLSRRINQHYSTKFYPETVIYHHHARRSYKDLRLLWYHIGSAIYYFNKWGWFSDKDRDEINQRALQQIYVTNEQ